MERRMYKVVRDLHLYVGLFVSPFVLVFAVSVFFLGHSSLRATARTAAGRRVVAGMTLPENVATLSGRPLVETLQPVLAQAGVHGEVGWIQHHDAEHQLVIPVTVPGQLTTVTLDLLKHEATVEAQPTGLADALVTLHKSPGPHLADLRRNWVWMKWWSWLADATVYWVLLVSASGVYLWYVLHLERRVGIALLIAGALSLCGIAYALSH